MGADRDYSDTLRTLGRFLDHVGAAEIEITDREDLVTMSFLVRRGPAEERQYSRGEIEALRTSARLMRGLFGGLPRFSTSELLRALGRELDAAGAENVALSETADGFWVTASMGSNTLNRLYTYNELVTRAQDYHRWRVSCETTVPAELAESSPGTP